MRDAKMPWSGRQLVWIGSGAVVFALAMSSGAVRADQNSGATTEKDATAKAQQSPGARTQSDTGKAQSSAGTTGAQPEENEEQPPALPANATAEQRRAAAWKMLEDALADEKHSETRIEGLAAVGLLRGPRSEKMITRAMDDQDVDVRTAAVLAAGLTKDRNLTTPLRNMLDDKEPQVVFTAATTLWKMNDRSGEDILMAVADGDRKAQPTVMHGTEHKIDKDLHDPAMLARMGAMQGATMLLGPFGYGLTAYQFMKQSGGNSARVSAIEDLAEERTEPIHEELIAALADKDLAVRAAAAKALVDYHDKATQMSVYALMSDTKQPVRLTAAAAYLRTTGAAGPTAAVAVKAPTPKR